MKRLLYAGILLSFLLFAVASPGFADVMEVHVSIPPQKWLSDKLGGDKVITHVLVAKGQDPHTYDPTPKQISALARSRLYFTIGMEFEEQIVHKLAETVAGLRFVDSTRGITRIAMTEEGHHGEHEVGHEAGHEAQGVEEAHHHDGADPHVWLSPRNLQIMAEVMAKEMAATDPANKAVYEQNLAQLHAELDQLHDFIHKELDPYKGSSFYIFHPSFGYFAKEYNLVQQAVEVGGKSPSPRQLSALIEMARKEGVKIIFVQPQFDTKSAESVARAIGGSVEPLDNLAEDVAGNLKIMTGKIKTALAGKNEMENKN
jgi:zinc transport system substrate-binding protein